MGFTDVACNLIPAQHGSSVVYVSGCSNDAFIRPQRKVLIAGATHHFPSTIFPAKTMEGITETNTRSQSGSFSITKHGGESQPIYLYSLPPGSIHEVYFGIRADDDITDQLYYDARARHDLTVFQCSQGESRD